MTNKIKLNILFLSEQMDVGGTQKEILILSRQLQRLGHNPIIASNGGRLIRDIENLKIQHYNLPSKTGRRACFAIGIIAFPFSLLQIIRIIKRKRINLIHSYASFLPIAIGCLASRILRIPFFITLNDGILDYPLKLSILKSLNIYKYSDKVIVVSDEMKNLILDHRRSYVEEQKIIVIPNIINIDEYPLNVHVSYIRSAINIPYAAQRIVWVGRLASDKIGAITSLINSTPTIVSKFLDTQVLIVGQGPKYRQVKELAEKINNGLAKEVVIVTGFLREVIPIMLSADIIIGMGRVIIEAMACSKPVIVVGHIIGQFGGNFGGILTKNNSSLLQKYNYSGRDSKLKVTPDRISTACIKLLSDKNYREQLGEFGRQLVEKDHDARTIAKRMENIYRNVIYVRARHR